MSLPLATIRTAISRVLDGSAGSVRTITPGTFVRGGEPGESINRHQVQALQSPRFWILFSGFSQHDGTPVSSRGPFRVDQLPVTVRLTYRLEHDHLESLRDDVYDRIVEHGDLVWQALSMPGNLSTVSQDSPDTPLETHIVSGCLVPPYEYSIVDEDWENHLLISELSAVAVVQIPQVTP